MTYHEQLVREARARKRRLWGDAPRWRRTEPSPPPRTSSPSGAPLPAKIKLRPPREVLPITARVREMVLPGRARPIDVVVAVSRFYGMSPLILTNRTRTFGVAHKRQTAMYICRLLCRKFLFPDAPVSFPSIARAFGMADHTTVVHACKVVALRLRRDRELYDETREIIAMIREETDCGEQDEDLGSGSAHEADHRGLPARADAVPLAACEEGRGSGDHLLPGAVRSYGVGHCRGEGDRERSPEVQR